MKIRIASKIAAGLGLTALAGTLPITGWAAAPGKLTDKTPSMAPPFTLVSIQAKTLQDAAVVRAEKTATLGAVSADKKTLAFRQKSVRLVFHTGPETDMLSYRVRGLRNPTIVVPRGAVMHVLFLNNDGDMLHNVRFGVKPAALSDGPALMKESVGAAPLPPVSGGTLHGAEITIKAPGRPGKFAYFCTVRGHANGGMWGVIQVR